MVRTSKWAWFIVSPLIISADHEDNANGQRFRRQPKLPNDTSHAWNDDEKWLRRNDCDAACLRTASEMLYLSSVIYAMQKGMQIIPLKSVLSVTHEERSKFHEDGEKQKQQQVTDMGSVRINVSAYVVENSVDFHQPVEIVARRLNEQLQVNVKQDTSKNGKNNAEGGEESLPDVKYMLIEQHRATVHRSGFTRYEMGGLQMWRRLTDKTCVLVAKGTNPKNMAEVEDDLNFKAVEFGPKESKMEFRVHGGFYNYVFNELRAPSRAEEWIRKHGCQGDILITGHSLGGAAADLIQISTEDFASRSTAFTFGEPLIYLDRESAGNANFYTRPDSLKRFVSVEEEAFLGTRKSSLDAVTAVHHSVYKEVVHRTVGIGLYGGHKRGLIDTTPWPTNNLACVDLGVHLMTQYRGSLDYFSNSTPTMTLPDGSFWNHFHRKNMPDIAKQTGEALPYAWCKGDHYLCPIWQDRESGSKLWECA